MRRQLRATIRATRARAAIATELNSPQQLPAALREVCTQLQASSDADSAFIVVEASDVMESFVVSAAGSCCGELSSVAMAARARVANDEIGRLASSFEEMRRQLRATIRATRGTG